jgi:pimeloyl-ACP methyl ester carboxylesterase
MIEGNAMHAGFVTSEGDELYYEVRGSGRPVLMIPGGGGNGGVYSAVADILSDEYKVITYDRRANARSTLNTPQNFEISQQSRDAVAVLTASGETSAFIFGNSSGAVIALAIAKAQPQAVRAVIVHEAPMARLHPQPKKWQRFFAGVYWMAFRLGPSLAGIRFLFGIGVPALRFIRAREKAETYTTTRPARNDERLISSKDTREFFLTQELLPVTNYLLDEAVIRKNGVKVFSAVGEYALSRKTWLARTAQSLAERLGCELITFPGHHGSFMDLPDEWAATLRAVLHKA